MQWEEFAWRWEIAKTERPVLFELDRDRPVDRDAIASAEARLGVTLPAEYVRVLEVLGGGYIGFVVVYSLDPASQANLVHLNQRDDVPGRRFLAFSDNGCGDLYAFEVVNGRCAPEVMFLDHESGTAAATSHATILDYIVDAGLKS